ncbi:PREDICTED: putative sodium-dependent excitatory amino acid transporter glt-6 [Papilio polytes]|uniref:putative sodium-dependent excitatory amino acid transporter glt-6 n=1 Tax=Papilio polytes TaxID=76194 RepID=UPI000676A9CC|nr:PREDICTED: putative sodium-dependent excitatory amino acid transporter glt-6 [Papilio polytes]
MEKGARLSEYLFATMGSGDRGPKTTEDRCAEVEPTGLRKCLVDNAMLVVTLIGVLAGVTIGFGLRPYNLGPDMLMAISYPGEIFMRLLKLMILPLIIASLIAGSASLNAKMSGKIAVRTLLYFILTSLFNAFLGILLAVLIHPGKPELRDTTNGTPDKRDHRILDSFFDIGRNIFPDNIVQATFQQSHTVYRPALVASNLTGNDTVPTLVRVVSERAGTNTLGLVFFCLVFGSVLGSLGPKGQVVINFFQAIFEVTMKMVTAVMWFTPVGVSSIIAGKILGVSDVVQMLSQLAWFIMTVTIGVFLYQLVIMQLIYFSFLRRNPYKFYFGLSHAMLTAAATASAAAALPVTFRSMEGRLQIDPRITRFVLPIGCNINMDGTALFLSVSCIFICQMNDMALGFPQYAAVLDRIRTTNNMLGDCYAAAVVEHLSKKELMACDSALTEPTESNGLLQTSNTELDLEIITSGNKSIVSEDVIIDMHLRKNSTASNNKV